LCCVLLRGRGGDDLSDCGEITIPVPKDVAVSPHLEDFAAYAVDDLSKVSRLKATGESYGLVARVYICTPEGRLAGRANVNVDVSPTGSFSTVKAEIEKERPAALSEQLSNLLRFCKARETFSAMRAIGAI